MQQSSRVQSFRTNVVGFVAATLGTSLCFVACVGDDTATAQSTPDGAAPGTDAAPSTTTDAMTPAADSAVDAADASIAPTYFDVTDANNWSAYDLSDPGAFGSALLGFAGGVLAGKYVYFNPASGTAGNGVMARYDTTAPFKTKSSWTTYDLKTTVDPGGGYSGAVFDGANVFVVPYDTGNVLRFDAAKSFVDASSWSSYSIAATYNGAVAGAAFDGQYVYTVPFSATPLVLRYDTKAGFTTAASWTSRTVTGGSYLSLPAFDKRYLYFPSGSDGKINRFDTQSSFTVDSSWDSFDAASVSAGFKGALGSTFDGRYLYLTPYHFDNSSVTMRYDTTKPFAQTTSWEMFDLVDVDATALNSHGGTFDGRYVYYPPYNAGAALLRYDTTQPFTAKTSWQSFKLAGATANLGVYSGIVFDGEYLYLIPQVKNVGGVLTSVTIPRFHARTPKGLPAFTASFQ